MCTLYSDDKDLKGYYVANNYYDTADYFESYKIMYRNIYHAAFLILQIAGKLHLASNCKLVKEQKLGYLYHYIYIYVLYSMYDILNQYTFYCIAIQCM